MTRAELLVGVAAKAAAAVQLEWVLQMGTCPTGAMQIYLRFEPWCAFCSMYEADWMTKSSLLAQFGWLCSAATGLQSIGDKPL